MNDGLWSLVVGRWPLESSRQSSVVGRQPLARFWPAGQNDQWLTGGGLTTTARFSHPSRTGELALPPSDLPPPPRRLIDISVSRSRRLA